MTTRHPNPDTGTQRLADARAARLRDEDVQRDQATRAVDSHATDQEDRAMLMAMLGLDAQPVGDRLAGAPRPIN
ncbi:hypothetical protein [Actinocrispum sp. NPDC049592]|uniref:hypothetical protein n=1 Tax=Actinocrispum sp. NPDC049592 TaxID=3154835 RepID=UPI003419F168